MPDRNWYFLSDVVNVISRCFYNDLTSSCDVVWWHRQKTMLCDSAPCCVCVFSVVLFSHVEYWRKRFCIMLCRITSVESWYGILNHCRTSLPTAAEICCAVLCHGLYTVSILLFFVMLRQSTRYTISTHTWYKGLCLKAAIISMGINACCALGEEVRDWGMARNGKLQRTAPCLVVLLDWLPLQ